MAKLPKPSKPLKILTIDGGGLQGISTLLILDSLLSAIAQNNRVLDSKPRPCDVFDVIAGIGPGGWLALLLGRFQMDVSSALAEWYNLIDCIEPRSKTEELRMRLVQRSYFHTGYLVEQIDQLTQFYETGDKMFFTPPNSTRCKHVFVPALKTDSKDPGYTLFRTYSCPEGSKVLDGPSDPREYKISHAFGVTGAARYFTPPWKEKKDKLKFLDTQFPSPHNITELALDEMWGLYGTDVEISVVVNIGPGIPSASDYRHIAKRFSWGSKAAKMDFPIPKSRSPSGSKEVTTDSKRFQSHEYKSTDEIPHEESGVSHRLTFNRKLRAPAGDAERRPALARHTTFGDERNVGIEEKLKRDEKKIESDIRTKLKKVYKENGPPYYRLAPDRSAPGTAQNDTSSPRASFVATRQFLQRNEEEIKKISQRMLPEVSAQAR